MGFRDKKIKKGDQGIDYGEEGMSNIRMRPRVESTVKSFPPGLDEKQIRKQACEKIPFFPSTSVVKAYRKLNSKSTESNELKEHASFCVQKAYVNQPIQSEDESSDVDVD